MEGEGRGDRGGRVEEERREGLGSEVEDEEINKEVLNFTNLVKEES